MSRKYTEGQREEIVCPTCGGPAWRVYHGEHRNHTVEHRNPLVGLPVDLARVLRDQGVIVPQDAAVFELIAKWQNAPSNTASAEMEKP
jgi:hypothetical protein